PNPSYGIVSLDLPSDTRKIALLDAAGRQIKGLRPSPKLTLDLPPGIYFLQIKTETYIGSEKVIILKH
ncbi:MAG TPA: T9SS type A sorting domain-containing protein, partial [bacterium (Candidatus Stahlbacteria)]|nr:T9SS type A sorting domain-containing protein [Candidatus Stahlbacteria bacterium]